MGAKTIKCPQCRAVLPVSRALKGVVRCEYCNKEVVLRHTRPVDLPPKGLQPPHGQAHQYAYSYKKHFLYWIVGVVVLVFVAGLGQFMSQRRGVGPALPPLSKPAWIARGEGVPPELAPEPRKMRWSGWSPPYVLPINDDEVEDFVAGFEAWGGGEEGTFVGAFDGKNFELLWEVGPFAAGDNSYAVTGLAVAGGHVLLGDAQARIHRLSVKTGEAVGEPRTMGDRVESMHAPRDGTPVVWVEMSDKKHELWKMETGEHRRAKRPRWLPREVELLGNSACWHPDFHRSRKAYARCRRPSKAPRVKGFGAEYVITDGQSSVAIGERRPGTSVQMLVGFRSRKEALWVRNLAEGNPLEEKADAPVAADLVHGRLILFFSGKEAAVLKALDPASGETRWSTDLPGTDRVIRLRNMVQTPDRIYLAHWASLYVIDAGTGQVLYHLGSR